jgi:hypothetical protein
MEVTYDSKRLFTEPYVKVRMGTTTKKTKVYKGGDKNYKGSFFEKFIFPISGPTGLTFEVYDDDVGKDDYLGSATIPLSDIQPQNGPQTSQPHMPPQPNGQPQWYPVMKNNKSFGKIQIQLTLRQKAPVVFAHGGAVPIINPYIQPVAHGGAVANPYGQPVAYGHPQPVAYAQPAYVQPHVPVYSNVSAPKTRVNKKGKVKKLKLKHGKWTSSSSDSLDDILKKGLKKLF